MEGLENRSDVITGVGEELGSRVLDVLMFIDNFGGCARENAIAIINMGCGEGVDQGFSTREGEGWMETGNEVEKSSFRCVIHTFLKREIIVKNDSKVADVRGGENCETVDGKGKV